ncbi:hypothetical protein D918_03309 [Trichuris suis]|nr:hypothetical protein D918_03309 [Trichuris suis]
MRVLTSFNREKLVLSARKDYTVKHEKNNFTVRLVQYIQMFKRGTISLTMRKYIDCSILSMRTISFY